MFPPVILQRSSRIWLPSMLKSVGFDAPRFGIRVRHYDFLHRDSFAGEHGAVHRLFAIHIVHPAIVAADADRRVGRLAVGNFQRRALDVKCSTPT